MRHDIKAQNVSMEEGSFIPESNPGIDENTPD